MGNLISYKDQYDDFMKLNQEFGVKIYRFKNRTVKISKDLRTKVLFLLLYLLATALFSEPSWYAERPNIGAHDPTVIKDKRGVYTLLSTNNWLEIKQSGDMIHWKSGNHILSGVPDWVPDYIADNTNNVWAPHISYRNNKYWVYYCLSQFGTTKSVIGLATNSTLDPNSSNHKWHDHQKIIQTAEGSNYNAIDPELVIDYEGEPWLIFGSWWSGIKLIKIDPVSGKQSHENPKIYTLAARDDGQGIEGASMLKHNGYYYLFTSWDLCCRGKASTYRIMVGRSENITGPYFNKNGKKLTEGFATELLSEYGRYIGPGGGSPFKDGRRDYFVHHFYDGNTKRGRPTLQIREIIWTNDNWPLITQPYLGRSRAFEAEHAKFEQASIQASNKASNQEYLELKKGSQVEFHIKTLEAGKYILRIRYALKKGNAENRIKINHDFTQSIVYPATGHDTNFTNSESGIITQEIVLKEGYNTVLLQDNSAALNLDRIDMIKSCTTWTAGGSFENGAKVKYIQEENDAILSDGGWIQYEYLNFGREGRKYLQIEFKNNFKGELKLCLDNRENSIATITESTPMHFLKLPYKLKGVHDLYIFYKGSDKCTLNRFKLIQNQPPIK